MNMEREILDVLKDVFELDSIDESCSQKNCDKWDSMGQLYLVAELEDKFNITIEPEEMERITCFNDIVDLLKNKGIK